MTVRVTGADPAARLCVYTRSECSLCDEMIVAAREWLAGRGLALEVRDVDADPATVARFGLKVPVLTLDGRYVCHGRFAAARLERMLSGA